MPGHWSPTGRCLIGHFRFYPADGRQAPGFDNLRRAAGGGDAAAPRCTALAEERTVQGLIRRADTWLKVNRPDYYATLRPGLDDAVLDAYAARFGLVLPTAFRQLYRWRDGQDLGVDAEALVHNHMFVPLSNSASR